MKKIAVGLGTLLILLSLNVEAFSLNLTPIGDATTWPGTPFRWMDIADKLYSNNYHATYTYQNATVTVEYDSTSTTFSGTLTATGLKPNFAYQMKLVGDPSKSVWTNEQLGYSGRWWRVQPNPGNSTDADYDNNKNNPDYIFQGYLLFDFFITDEQGSATINFTADSSFHVLWATPDSTGNGTGHRFRGPNDGPVRYYDFIASPDKNPYAYDADYGSAHVGVYAEWEPGRVLPEELILSNGTYDCQFILTEESFHQTGLGGNWAGAMGADILFAIEKTTTTTILPTTTTVIVTTSTTSTLPTTSILPTTTTTSVQPTTTTTMITTTTTALQTPSPPSNLAATAISSSQINLSWTDNSANETGFKIERATSSSGPFRQIATVGTNVKTYQNKGLKRNTTYYYQVRAYNTAGNSAYSNIASAITPRK